MIDFKYRREGKLFIIWIAEISIKILRTEHYYYLVDTGDCEEGCVPEMKGLFFERIFTITVVLRYQIRYSKLAGENSEDLGKPSLKRS